MSCYLHLNYYVAYLLIFVLSLAIDTLNKVAYTNPSAHSFTRQLYIPTLFGSMYLLVVYSLFIVHIYFLDNVAAEPSQLQLFIQDKLIDLFLDLLTLPMFAFSLSMYLEMKQNYPIILLVVMTCSFLVLSAFFLLVYQLKTGSLYLHMGEILIFYIYDTPNFIARSILIWATGTAFICYCTMSLFKCIFNYIAFLLS